MARSNHGKKQGKSQQKDALERKRDERTVRSAYRKKKKDESYLAEDENFASFSNQLQIIGLKLRDIPGDGYFNFLYIFACFHKFLNIGLDTSPHLKWWTLYCFP